MAVPAVAFPNMSVPFLKGLSVAQEEKGVASSVPCFLRDLVISESPGMSHSAISMRFGLV